MWRTAGFLVLIFISIFWLPWWLSLVIFAGAVVLCQGTFVFLIPAFIMDSLYASHAGGFFHNHLVFFLVLAALCIKYFILTRTRVGDL